MLTSYIIYPNPAPSIAGATTSLINSSAIDNPVLVFTSTNNGQPTNRSGFPVVGTPIEQTNAVTTIALCNTGVVDLSNENTNSVSVNIYFAKKGIGALAANLVVSNLIVPAGETVFFSEERMVLDGGDTIWVGTSQTNLLSVTVSSLKV
jgi:hypothetical protein